MIPTLDNPSRPFEISKKWVWYERNKMSIAMQEKMKKSLCILSTVLAVGMLVAVTFREPARNPRQTFKLVQLQDNKGKMVIVNNMLLPMSTRDFYELSTLLRHQDRDGAISLQQTDPSETMPHILFWHIENESF